MERLVQLVGITEEEVLPAEGVQLIRDSVDVSGHLPGAFHTIRLDDIRTGYLNLEVKEFGYLRVELPGLRLYRINLPVEIGIGKENSEIQVINVAVCHNYCIGLKLKISSTES